MINIQLIVKTAILRNTLILLFGLSLLPYAIAEQNLIKKGAYLARAADCMACHSVPGTNQSPFVGGYEFPMPMGKIISSNITPSKQFGIGSYTESQFKRAIKEGVNAQGRHLYPAMPYTEYGQMSDEDIAALYAYFMKSVQAVDSAPKASNDLKFPFNLPGLMWVWNGLFLDKQNFMADAKVSAELNRGRYLVDALAHCGTCHTPRNDFMASNKDRYLAGGEVNGWFAPNITSDKISGIGGWSNQELVQYFKNGHVSKKGQAADGMAEAVEKSLKYLTEPDLQAIALYLKTVPAIRNPNQTLAAYGVKEAKPLDLALIETGVANDPNVKTNSATVNGPVLYNAACASCHGVNGEGSRDEGYPSLTQNSAVGAMEANNLVMAIAFGIERKGADKKVLMPAFAVAANSIGSKLSDEQIAAVASYVIDRFGQSKITLTAKDVATIKKGGKVPLLIQAAPILAIIALLAVLFIIVLIARKFWCKKRR